MIREKHITRTVTQVAEELGLSMAVVRRHAQNGNLPDAVWNELPSGSGYYTLGRQSVSWLRENVEPRAYYGRSDR